MSIEDLKANEEDLTDEEIYCDVHAYDQDIPIPVINNWTSERIIDDGEQAAIVFGLT